MKQIRHRLCGAAVLLLIVCRTADGAAEISLRERIVIHSPVVRLGDVAAIATSDREEQQRLAALLLMPAPAPGTQQFLRLREVQDLLAAHGEDMGKLHFAERDQVAIVSPEARQGSGSVITGRGVDRQALMLTGRGTRAKADPIDRRLTHDVAEQLGDQFRQAIVTYLTSKAGRAGAWRVSCDIGERYLAMLRSATSAPQCQGGSEPWTGRQRFVISFSTAGGVEQVPVYAEVALATEAVVVIRPVRRGDIITAAHVEMQTIDYIPQASDRRVPVESEEKIIGMEARQAIQVGDIVFTDQVQAPLLVKRGDVITVTSQGGGIRVRTTARARQDGARGDLVQVESLETKEPFDVRVTGTREAAIFAGAPAVAAQPKIEGTKTARRR